MDSGAAARKTVGNCPFSRIVYRGDYAALYAMLLLLLLHWIGWGQGKWGGVFNA